MSNEITKIYDHHNASHHASHSSMPGGHPAIGPTNPPDYGAVRYAPLEEFAACEAALRSFFKTVGRLVGELSGLQPSQEITTVEAAELVVARVVSLHEMVYQAQQELNQAVPNAAYASGPVLSRILHGPYRYAQARVSEYNARLQELRDAQAQSEQDEATRQARQSAFAEYQSGLPAAMQAIAAGELPEPAYRHLVPPVVVEAVGVK